jgi:hypothetical protein
MELTQCRFLFYAHLEYGLILYPSPFTSSPFCTSALANTQFLAKNQGETMLVVPILCAPEQNEQLFDVLLAPATFTMENVDMALNGFIGGRRVRMWSV